MDFDQAITFAQTGHTLMLPNYVGYFKWNYGKSKLYFQNGDYKTSEIEENVKKRKDWIYII